MNAISVQNINKHFYDPVEFQVLKNISFDVKKGEFVSIIGKSGSGKSTLLYLLSTMDTNYKGNIAINGTQVTGLSQNELAKFRNEQIGFVFQFHFLLPEFTVLDNVMLPALKLNKRTKDEIENKSKLIIKDKTGDSILMLDLGIYNYNIPGSYVKFADTNQSLLVSTNLTTDTSPFYWMPNDLINIGSSSIKNVQIYNNNQMINLLNEDGLLKHQNALPKFSEISESKIEDVQKTLTDVQHNGYVLRSYLPASPNFEVRFSFQNNVVLFMKLYDIQEKGIHVTFDWNYLNDDIKVTKFIDPDLSGNQFQLGSLSLLNDFAFNVPQFIYDNLNIKLREKTD